MLAKKSGIFLVLSLFVILSFCFVTASSFGFSDSTIENNSILEYGINNSAYISINSGISGDYYILNNFGNSLEGWWRFENGANDEFGLNNGTISGVNSASGKYGNGYKLGRGTITFSDTTFSFGASQPHSFGIWVKLPENYSQDGFVLSLGNGAYDMGGHDEFLAFNSSASPYLTAVGSWGGVWKECKSNTNISLNQWHYLSGVYDGENQSLYIDGVLTNSCSLEELASDWGVNNYLRIGSDGYGGGSYFNGTVDELVLLNRTLSSSEILSLYNATQNAYQNNFTDILPGKKTFQVFGVSSAGGFFSTEKRTIFVKGVSCGLDMVENSTMILDLVCPTSYSYAVRFQEENITLDCQGHTINGQGRRGIYSEYSGVHIKNCNLINFSNEGIYFQGVSDSSIENTSIETTNTYLEDTNYGIYFDGVNNVSLINSNIFSIGSWDNDGIYISGSGHVNISDSSVINNLSRDDFVNALKIEDSSNINIFNSNFNSTSGNAVSLSHVDSSNFSNLTVYGFSDNDYTSAFSISSSSYNTLENSNIFSNSSYTSAVSTINSPYWNITNNVIFALNNTAIKIDAAGSGCLITKNNITAKHWISDYDYDVGDAFNNSVFGNIYYFSNGTGSFEVYNLTDSNGDGWADSGSLPFNSSMQGIIPFSELVFPPSLSNDGGWIDTTPVYDEDLSTGTSTLSLAEMYYGYFPSSGVINKTLIISTNFGTRDINIPHECDVPGSYFAEYSFNISLSSSGVLKVSCITSGSSFWESNNQTSLLTLTGVTSFNGSNGYFEGYEPVWINSGADYHPFVGNFSQEVSSSNDSNNNNNNNGDSSNQGTKSSGYSSNTYYNDSNFFIKGNSFYLYDSDKIMFSVQSVNHTLILDYYNSSSAKVTIHSNPIEVYLEKGVAKMVDLNNDKINEVRVVYNGLSNSKAILFIQEINPSSNLSSETIPKKSSFSEVSSNVPSGSSFNWILILWLVLLIVVMSFIIFGKHKKKKF